MPDWVLRQRPTGGSGTANEFDVERQGLSYPLAPVPGELTILRSVLQITQAVLGANYFDEALEVIAEQALVALDAASLSISRWNRADNTLRTLINVGDLGPGEERWPENEVYPIPATRACQCSDAVALEYSTLNRST